MLEELNDEELIALAIGCNRTEAAAKIAANLACEQTRKVKEELRRRAGPEGGLIVTESGAAVVSRQSAPITKLNTRATLDAYGIEELSERGLITLRAPYAQRVKLYDADEIIIEGEIGA